MTWSIIARDSATGQFGIAVATKFFAVGARVPYIAANIGGIATQALVNPYYGIDGLKLLREGRSPREVVDTLIAADSGRETRQLHIMDAAGRIASHTGRECVDWCGQSRAAASRLPATCWRARACWMTQHLPTHRTKTCRSHNG